MSARINARIRQNQMHVWNQYIDLANRAYESGQFDVGNKMLRAASRECACDEEMCITLAETFERLADGRAQSKDFVHSERLLKKAIALHERINNSESEGSVSRLLFLLAERSAESNKHEVALRYFGKAIIVSKRMSGFSVQRQTDLTCRLCQLWTEKNRHNEALIVLNYLDRISVSLSPVATDSAD